MKNPPEPRCSRRQRDGTSGAALIMGVLFPAIASAQWPHRVDLDLLITDETILASAPAVAADGNGGVFAVWNDDRNAATNGQDVFAQHYNSAGVAVWPDNGVPVCTAPNQQDNAVVVSAGDGAVYVVWSDERGNPNNERVFAQFLDADGEPQWAENGIRVGPNEFDQAEFVATSDGAGNLLVCWSEASNDFRSFVQKIDSDGNLLWGSGGFEFSSGVFDGAAVFNVVSDEAGGVVLGWIRFGDNPRTVFVRRILADGTPAFDAVPFGNDAQALANFVPMAPDGTGGAIVGWQVGSGATGDLRLQRVDGDGDLPWGEDSLPLVEADNAQENLQIVTDGSGGAFLAWDDARSDDDNVFVQHVTAAGAFSFPEGGLPVGEEAVERFAARMVADGEGGAIISFRQNQDGTFAQRIDTEGTRLWGGNGAQLTDNGTVNFPNLTSDGRNGVILGALAFSDGNRAALKRILASGKLPSSRLINISTRAFIGTGANLAIPGFVIGGTGNKSVLIRAVGPRLAGPPFDVPGVLADPELTLYDAARQPIHARDNWGEAGDADLVVSTSATLGAFPLPAGSNDAALVVELAPGLYTAGITGVGETTGVGLVEVYDGDEPTSTSRLINISSRVFVGTGDELAIPGLVIGGEATMTLLIRAVGPRLGSAPFNLTGLLADPVLTLYDRDGEPIRMNDDWEDDGAGGMIAETGAAIGAFTLPAGSADAAMVVTLAPGLYTAGARGANDETGICLVEIYEVP